MQDEYDFSDSVRGAITKDGKLTDLGKALAEKGAKRQQRLRCASCKLTLWIGPEDAALSARELSGKSENAKHHPGHTFEVWIERGPGSTHEDLVALGSWPVEEQTT